MNLRGWEGGDDASNFNMRVRSFDEGVDWQAARFLRLLSVKEPLKAQ